ncbi:hypothetical protein [Aequorivita marina]|uniref:hypothetical protein n=1 Tax=Aequorivita marina TaxID=3073654 RepID=UPI002875631A|nr:hypothetical protein [Aequorivita sp. S2608]MDS1298500.1 hypothetical protein [Aequorivita sp. S2608]
MHTSTYTYLLANPQRVTSEDLDALDGVIKKHPYFQSARALQLKGLKNQDSYLYNEALKMAAAHTTDRDILFEYITSEKFVQNEISQNILQHDDSVNEIKVVSEDVSQQVNDENDQAEIKKAEDILNPDLFQRKVQSVTNLVADKDEVKEKEAEEALQPNKPLEFTKNDTHSFSEWLKLTKAKPITRDGEDSNADSKISEENETSNSKTANNENEAANMSPEAAAEEENAWKSKLIDKFIQERPKITPSENQGVSAKKNVKNSGSKNPSTAYTQSDEALMTETLAKVYLQQKNYKKAIQAYKILILKNPEKSGFFADQIRAIEKLINSEQS